jgi:hypothetical protein
LEEWRGVSVEGGKWVGTLMLSVGKRPDRRENVEEKTGHLYMYMS